MQDPNFSPMLYNNRSLAGCNYSPSFVNLHIMYSYRSLKSSSVFILVPLFAFLPPAYVVRGKVMFWHVSVHQSVCPRGGGQVQPAGGSGPAGGGGGQVQLRGGGSGPAGGRSGPAGGGGSGPAGGCQVQPAGGGSGPAGQGGVRSNRRGGSGPAGRGGLVQPGGSGPAGGGQVQPAGGESGPAGGVRSSRGGGGGQPR